MEGGGREVKEVPVGENGGLERVVYLRVGGKGGRGYLLLQFKHQTPITPIE